MQDLLNVYVGWDSREDIAYQICKKSLMKYSDNIKVKALKQADLKLGQLYMRQEDKLGSTEFTFTRFYVPLLQSLYLEKQYNDWVVFVDCDFLYFDDLYERLKKYLDTKYAVMVVKHDYTPSQKIKMDGKTQHVYPRKNWSSFIVFNCKHKANHNISNYPDFVNTKDGQYLHRFQWLKDEEIGSLPIDFNWLEGEYKFDKNHKPIACHYTNGGPWFENYMNVDYAKEWLDLYLEYYNEEIKDKIAPNHLLKYGVTHNLENPPHIIYK